MLTNIHFSGHVTANHVIKLQPRDMLRDKKYQQSNVTYLVS